MKKILLVIVPMVFAVAVGALLAEIPCIASHNITSKAYSSGLKNLGTDFWESINNESAFQINSTTGLLNLAHYVACGADFEGKTVYLSGDIDYTILPFPSNRHVAIGTGDKPFKGIFDGCGYSVKYNNIEVLYDIEDYIGFFGKTESAIIRNLEITCITAITASRTYFGSIVGFAKDTKIYNCINKININNTIEDGYAGGIVGAGEDFKIINCINYGSVIAANGIAAGIVATDAGEVLLCANLGKLNDIIGFSNNENIKDWSSVAPSTEEVKAFNTSIHALKNSIELKETKTRLCYWKLGNNILNICFPDSFAYLMFDLGIWNETKVQTNSTVVPDIDGLNQSEFGQKNLAVYMVTDAYSRYFDFISGSDNFARSAREVMQAKYSELLDELEDYQIGAGPTATTIFQQRIKAFITYGSTEIREISDVWYNKHEEAYREEVHGFAYMFITAWYEDCCAFVNSSDETIAKLGVAYNEYIETLNKLVSETEKDGENMSFVFSNAELFARVRALMTDAINGLDDIYYNRVVTNLIEELETAYSKLQGSVPKKFNNKAEKIFDEKMTFIITGWDNIENLTWIEYSNAVETAVHGSIAQFDKIYSLWRDEQRATLWGGIVGGIGLLALVIIGVLSFIIRQKNKRFNTLLFDLGNRSSKKEIRLAARAEQISRQQENQRNKVDEMAKYEREKAATFAKKEEEKKELESVQVRTQKEREELLAKQIKKILAEQKK